MVTIQDIARKAKVAPSTVSLVANRAGRVSEQTRLRVEQAIEQLGYRPRTRRRRDKHPGQYALVYAVSSLSPTGNMSSLTQLQVEGATSIFAGADGSMSIIGVWGSLADDPVLRAALRPGQLDGLILMGVYPEMEENARFIASLEIPVVAINRRAGQQGYSTVQADYYNGTRHAVASLVERGHQNFALSGLSRWHWPTWQRYRGLCDELESRHLPAAKIRLGEGYIFDGDREQTVQFCMEQVEQGATALLIGDGSAPAVVEALEQRGLNVPEHVSIIGCDGLGMKVGREQLTLSTLDFDKFYLGELAARTVIELHRNRSRLASINRMIRMRLVEGETVADRHCNSKANEPAH